MKNKKLLSLLCLLPLLSGCRGEDLSIPQVDVDKIKISLPAKPVYNTGAIRNEGDFDFLDFYEISDFHGAVNYEAHDSGNYIGMPMLADYMSKKRGNNPGGTILLSSGDMFQGSAESNLTRGYMVNYCMNYMGFDSMTIGNHEFDWTDEWIKKNANLTYENYKIPYLGANIFRKDTETLPDFLQSSVVVERGNYKIGIVGTIGEKLNSSILKTYVKDYSFLPEKEIVENEAQKLRESGCDIVIWSTHDGADTVEDVSGVDAIFGGHAHKNVVTDIGTTPLAATKNYGRGVAHIEIKINRATKEKAVTTCEVDDNPVSLPNISSNSDIKNIMSQYDKGIKKVKNIKVGKCKETLEVDNELKYMVVDAMQQEAKKQNVLLNLGIEENSIIAAYHNVSGGIRSNIEKGKIRYSDIYKAFPFDNEIVLIKVSGEEYIKFAPTIGQLSCWHSFKYLTDIDKNKDYYIVTTDFLSTSSDYFKADTVMPDIEEDDLIRTGCLVREVFGNYVYHARKVDSSKYTSNEVCYRTVSRA